MKHSKIMLAVIATLLATWCMLGVIVYLLSDYTFKQSMSHPGLLFTMLLFGWIPSVIVAYDLDNKLID